MQTFPEPRLRNRITIVVSRAFANELRRAAGATGDLDGLVTLCLDVLLEAERVGDREATQAYHQRVWRAAFMEGQRERLALWLRPEHVTQIQTRGDALRVSSGQVLAGVVAAAAGRLAARAAS